MKHMGNDERNRIEVMPSCGSTAADIARAPGSAESTISRRNGSTWPSHTSTDILSIAWMQIVIRRFRGRLSAGSMLLLLHRIQIKKFFVERSLGGLDVRHEEPLRQSADQR